MDDGGFPRQRSQRQLRAGDHEEAAPEPAVGRTLNGGDALPLAVSLYGYDFSRHGLEYLLWLLTVIVISNLVISNPWGIGKSPIHKAGLDCVSLSQSICFLTR